MNKTQVVDKMQVKLQAKSTRSDEKDKGVTLMCQT